MNTQVIFRFLVLTLLTIGIPHGANSADLLPAGKNEAVSNVVSIQIGTIGGQFLPGGRNEAVSNPISLQLGTIGGQQLPSGRNEAVSNLISAQSGGAAHAIVRRKAVAIASADPTNSGGGVTDTGVEGSLLIAGETVTLSSDVPGQIFINGQNGGNDPGSLTDLTFVVPEDVDSLRIHAGDSADVTALIQPRTKILALASNIGAHLRHAGLKAEFFKLTTNAPEEELPSLSGLKPIAEEPVSSLNLHNSEQASGYFPVGNVHAPNFAVRLSGQFLAETTGRYLFYTAAASGATLTIDGKQQAEIHHVIPGLETPAPVQLTKGWHDLQLLVYAISGNAELVVSMAPPDGNKQIINPALLRAESGVLTALTGTDGKFTVKVPAWLDHVEVIEAPSTTNTHF